ncbi:hypothetical protein [Streptomyces sp. CBMA156]|uniref:hypothetical protein n=1 Tax=Streptomyces sp. CBMA156 TaxID=1930280 RepID=UPI001CB7F24E|nr:hypothetical protein [Streptomyces sp. CBMA156]
MNTSGLEPVLDPRSWGVAPDFPGMQDVIAGLQLPAGASMAVMSALETSRELIRYSYQRYEFATVAVTHALYALEQVLAERLAVDAPTGELIGRAVTRGILDGGVAAELDRALRIRDEVARGSVTSGTVSPQRAVRLTRAVFDAVAALLGPLPPADAPDGGGVSATDRIARLWEECRNAPFPESFVVEDIGDMPLHIVENNLAGLLSRELNGGLDDSGVAILWSLIAYLDRVVPLINEEYCAAYFARLRTVAKLAAERYLPPAT